MTLVLSGYKIRHPHEPAQWVKDDLRIGVGGHPGIIIYLYVAASVHKNVIV